MADLRLPTYLNSRLGVSGWFNRKFFEQLKYGTVENRVVLFIIIIIICVSLIMAPARQ
jgi:hypothetical protein